MLFFKKHGGDQKCEQNFKMDTVYQMSQCEVSENHWGSLKIRVKPTKIMKSKNAFINDDTVGDEGLVNERHPSPEHNW